MAIRRKYLPESTPPQPKEPTPASGSASPAANPGSGATTPAKAPITAIEKEGTATLTPPVNIAGQAGTNSTASTPSKVRFPCLFVRMPWLTVVEYAIKE